MAVGEEYAILPGELFECDWYEAANAADNEDLWELNGCRVVQPARGLLKLDGTSTRIANRT